MANVYTVAVGIVFVPIYINYLGVEAYGIIGAFTGLTAFVWLFDLGIVTNINRELSTFEDTSDKKYLLDLKTTLEATIYLIAVALFILLLGFVYLIAHYWLNAERFSPTYMTSMMAILAFSLALQFPTNFYLNGLMGLRQQVAINAVGIIFNTLRCVGAVVAIVVFEDKIKAFLLFQAGAALLNLLMLKALLSRSLATPDGYRGKVEFRLLNKIRRFASELFANNVVTILLTQADKAVLSRMFSLEQFGYYMLAYNIVTMTINTFSNSVNNVIFPNLVRYVKSEDTEELKRIFHLGTRVMAWGAVSIGTVLVFMPRQVLEVWTQNVEVVENTAPILSILAAAFAINIMMLIPYYLQHAYGRSHVSFAFNIISLAFFIPGLIFAAQQLGPVGAAIAWVVFQFVYFVTFVPVIRANFLNFSLLRYYRDDILKVLIYAGLIGFLLIPLLPIDGGKVQKTVVIFATFTVTCVGAFFIAGLYSKVHLGQLKRRIALSR